MHCRAAGLSMPRQQTHSSSASDWAVCGWLVALLSRALLGSLQTLHRTPESKGRPVCR